MEPSLLIVAHDQLRLIDVHLKLVIQKLLGDPHLASVLLWRPWKHHELGLASHPFSYFPCVKGDAWEGISKEFFTLFWVI